MNKLCVPDAPNAPANTEQQQAENQVANPHMDLLFTQFGSCPGRQNAQAKQPVKDSKGQVPNQPFGLWRRLWHKAFHLSSCV